MSNLRTARQTIEAELKHVEQGIAYYQAKAAALQSALEQIDRAETGTANKSRQRRSASTNAAASTRTSTSTRTTTGNKRSRQAGSKRQGKALPRMTRDFWLDFISHQPKSAIEIMNAAIASFDPSLDPDQEKKMKQRATQALQALLTSKQIKDVGAGRQRRYFLPLGKTAGSGKTAAKGKSSPADLGNTVLH